MFQMPETLRVWAPLNNASSLSLALPAKLRSDISAHYKNSLWSVPLRNYLDTWSLSTILLATYDIYA